MQSDAGAEMFPLGLTRTRARQRKTRGLKMRDTGRRESWVDVEDTDSTKGCRVLVWTNHPIKLYSTQAQGDGGVDGNADYLMKVIVGWEGYDMPLTRESLLSLSIAESNALTAAVAGAAKNPQ